MTATKDRRHGLYRLVTLSVLIVNLAEGGKNEVTRPFQTTKAYVPERPIPNTTPFFRPETKSERRDDKGVPYVDKNRVKIMGWNASYLARVYEESGKRSETFYHRLFNEFKHKQMQLRLGRQSAADNQTKVAATDMDKVEEFTTGDKSNISAEGNVTSANGTSLFSGSEPQDDYFEKYIRPDHITEWQIKDIIYAHNNVRSTVQPNADEMLKLSWDYDLEANAWDRIESCQFDLRSHREESLNIWAGWGWRLQSFDTSQPISTWAKEKAYFHQSLRVCLGGPCERYVRMVTRDTYKVGCAWRFCNSTWVYGHLLDDVIFMACDYRPNWRMGGSLLPYYVGRSCSFCGPDESCDSGLCSNGTREEVTGEVPWYVPPTTAAATEAPTTPDNSAEVALIVVGSFLGTTLVVTVLILIGVKITRLRKAGTGLKGFVKSLCNGENSSVAPSNRTSRQSVRSKGPRIYNQTKSSKNFSNI